MIKSTLLGNGLFVAIAALCAAGHSSAQDAKSIPDLANSQDSVSLNMPQMGVADALRMLGKLSNLNLVIDPNVSGVVDLFLEDVSIDEAWSSILDSANLSVSQSGDLLRIKPKTNDPAPAAPRETRVIKLKYISLGQMSLTGGTESSQDNRRQQSQVLSRSESGIQRDDAQDEAQLDQMLQRAFQDAITVLKDTRTNHLILSGAPMLLDQAQSIIDVLDQPISQILIEAMVVQVRTQAMEELGIDWGGVYTFQNTGGFSTDGARQRNEPGRAITETIAEDLNFASNVNQFNITLSALIDDGDAQILFKPRVLTQNNKEAYISSGQEIQIPSGLDINGNASFRERRVVLELGVTPQVMADGLISLGIRVKNDSIDFTSSNISGVPPLEINAVESFITLRDQDMAVIGGILSSQRSRGERRIPVLSSIPLLGRAFRDHSNRFEQSELLIVITPRIISDENGMIDYEQSTGIAPSPGQNNMIRSMGDGAQLWPEAPPVGEGAKREKSSNRKRLKPMFIDR